MTNQIYGRLTVLYRDETNSRKWVCQCECGKIKSVHRKSLINGETKSCGCYNKEIASRRKYNTYDLSNDYGIGFTHKGEEFYFDKEDFDKIKDYTWFLADGYVMSHPSKYGEFIFMHRLIMDCPEDLVVDHICTDKVNDNRKENLRLATRSQNGMNKKLLPSNKTGCAGVFFNESKGKYTTYIDVNYKRKYLGTFANKDDAIKARKEAEEKYFGEFAYKKN